MNVKIELTKDFELIELIGRGLSSEVYKGLRVEAKTEFTQVVAIKIFKSNRFRKKFQNELKNLSKVNHPNVVGVKDWGEFDGKFFLVTEYVHGFDLDSIYQDAQTLNLKTKKYIANQIFKGLNELRSKGIAHGDLKPSNIMISVSGEIKLVDISFDDVGQVFATPEFTAPEVLSGVRPNFQSDLYSLGIILSKLGIDQKSLTRLEPGDRSYDLYRWVNEGEEKQSISNLMRGLLGSKEVSEQSSYQLESETEELKSPEVKYGKSKSKSYFLQVLLHLMMFLAFGIYQESKLPQVYNLKLRSLKAYEFWNEHEWVSLPTNHILFAGKEDSLKKLRFRTPEGELRISISEATDFSKNIVIDAL